MLDTKYNHLSIEENKYENWKGKGNFEPTNMLSLNLEQVLLKEHLLVQN